ncbi:MAG: hypothetical protein JXQ81_10470 [Desulfuromonadales bacterium]|nr:hypothetical protein [Desulfuromonadales bacterium]
MKIYFIFLPLLIGLFLNLMLTESQSSDLVEHHEYVKVTGDKIWPFDWNLIRDDGLTLLTTLGHQRDTTQMAGDLSTHKWHVDDPRAKTLITVLRQDQKLVFQGKFNGKKVDRQVRIDSAPWYQALSLSLRQFSDPDKKGLEFWSIRPDTLDVHRLKVSKVAEENLEINNVLCSTIKLKIQLTGFKSAFWSCYYWLRKADGLFVRYEGPSGPPGWPLTTVELVSPCHQAQAKSSDLNLLSRLQE